MTSHTTDASITGNPGWDADDDAFLERTIAHVAQEKCRLDVLAESDDDIPAGWTAVDVMAVVDVAIERRLAAVLRAFREKYADA